MGDVEQGDVNEVEMLAPSSHDFEVSRDELRDLNDVSYSLLEACTD